MLCLGTCSVSRRHSGPRHVSRRAAAGRVARASSAFGLDEILARALQRRVRALGLPSQSTDLLTLMETEVKPVEMLLLNDEDFRALVARLHE